MSLVSLPSYRNTYCGSLYILSLSCSCCLFLPFPLSLFFRFPPFCCPRARPVWPPCHVGPSITRTFQAVSWVSSSVGFDLFLHLFQCVWEFWLILVHFVFTKQTGVGHVSLGWIKWNLHNASIQRPLVHFARVGYFMLRSGPTRPWNLFGLTTVQRTSGPTSSPCQDATSIPKALIFLESSC